MTQKQQARVPPNMATPVPPFVHQSLAMTLPTMGKKDDIDEMSDNIAKEMVKLSRLKMVRDTLNPLPQMQPQQQPIDYSSVFKALGDMNNNLASQLTNMIAQNSQNAQNPALMEVKHQIEKITERLENVNRGNQQSELETLFNGMARMDAMGGILRKSLGIPDSVKTATSDLPQLLGLEELRMRESREQRQHEERMKMLDRQFVVDDRNSTRQFNLDVMRFADERKRKDNTNKMLEDILGSVMDGIDLSPEEKNMLGIGSNAGSELPPPGYQPPTQAATDVLQPRVKSFLCQACGNRVQVPNPDTAEIECAGCHSVYSLDTTIPPVSPALPVVPAIQQEAAG